MDMINSIPELDFIAVHSYNITEEFKSNTETLTNEEVQLIKKKVLEELDKEELAQFNPKLILLDNQNSQKTIIVYAIQKNNNKVRDRMFVFENTKLLKILDRRQQPLKSFTP